MADELPVSSFFRSGEGSGAFPFQMAQTFFDSRKRKQDLDQRAIENDLRQKQVEAIMDVRQAQASIARAKLDQAAAYAAEQKQGWDTYHLKMSALDEANKGNPEWNAARRAQASEDVMFELSPQLFAGQPAVQQRLQSAKMMNDTRRVIAEQQAEVRKKAAEEATERTKIGASSRETVADIGASSREKIAAGKDTRTTTQKDTQALVESESAARMARGEPPLNPAEETARTAEVLGKRVAGSGKEKVQTAKQSDLEYLRTLSDPKEIDIFTTMLLGRAGQPKNEAQKLKYFSAQEKLRALKDQVFKKDEYDAAVKKILSDYEASLGESQTPATEPEKKFKFEFKGDRLQSVK